MTDPSQNLVQRSVVVLFRNLGQRVRLALEVGASRVHQKVEGVPKPFIPCARGVKDVVGGAVESGRDPLVAVGVGHASSWHEERALRTHDAFCKGCEPDPSAEVMFQAVDVLRVDADMVALPLTSPLLRAVADWLEATAEQIDESRPEFSMAPYPKGHDRRAMRVAIAALGDGQCAATESLRRECERLRDELPHIACPCGGDA